MLRAMLRVVCTGNCQCEGSYKCVRISVRLPSDQNGSTCDQVLFYLEPKLSDSKALSRVKSEGKNGNDSDDDGADFNRETAGASKAGTKYNAHGKSTDKRSCLYWPCQGGLQDYQVRYTTLFKKQIWLIWDVLMVGFGSACDAREVK